MADPIDALYIFVVLTRCCQLTRIVVEDSLSYGSRSPVLFPVVASPFSLSPLGALFCLSVCLYVCLSVYLSVCLSVFLSVCLSVGLSVCLSVSRSVGLSVCLSVGLSVCRSVGLSVCRSVGLSVCRSVGVVFGWSCGLSCVCDI